MAKIIFFDGHCSLCNNLVDRMMTWDKRHVLKFASLQGETARQILPEERLRKIDVDTVLYFREGQVYDRSTAILLSLRDIGGLWKIAPVFFVVPVFLRDLVYRFVAAIRFILFKRRETCRVPLPEERERLLP